MTLEGIVHPSGRDLKVMMPGFLGPFQTLFAQLFPGDLVFYLEECCVVLAQVQISNELGFNVRVLARFVALDTQRLQKSLFIALHVTSKGLTFTERSREQFAAKVRRQEIHMGHFGVCRSLEVFVRLTGIVPIFLRLVALQLGSLANASLFATGIHGAFLGFLGGIRVHTVHVVFLVVGSASFAGKVFIANSQINSSWFGRNNGRRLEISLFFR